MRRASAKTLRLLLALGTTGCEAQLHQLGDGDGGADVDANASGQDASARPARPCDPQWGEVTMPWAPGTRSLYSLGNWREHPYLNALPDTVEAITSDGRVLSCCRDNCRRYACGDESDHLTTIRVSQAGRSFEWTAGCAYYEDPVSLEITSCVGPGAIVVEGELRDRKPDRRPAHVILEGPGQLFHGTTGNPYGDDFAYAPGIDCAVEDGHFACPTLGFDYSALHSVLAGGARVDVMLEVDRCQVHKASLDVTCPATPLGLQVEVPASVIIQGRVLDENEVRASYENGESYPCPTYRDPALPAGRFGTPNEPLTKHLCPPAANDPWGRGQYDITAVSKLSSTRSKTYKASVTDPFDECGGSEPIRLKLAE